MRRLAFLLLLSGVTVSACSDQFSGRYETGRQVGSYRPTQLGVGAPGQYQAAPGEQHIAILLPMTGARAGLGQVLLQAAQFSFHAGTSPSLDVLDTGGNPAGAAAAATNAVANGDILILGPLTSAETAAVTPVSRGAGIPVLAFTNDSSISQPGVWPLGISPDQQSQRLVLAAQAQGKSRIAALLPDTDYGRAMAAALRSALQAQGLPEPNIRMHSPGMSAITTATRDLSDYADRRGPIDQKVKALRALGTTDARREAQELVKTPIPPPPFDVLLLADTGDELQEIAAVLPYYDIDRSVVQIIGPALWADISSGSAAVAGAWYAAPDSSLRSNFNARYTAEYGTAAPALADLAFDAASIARFVAEAGGPLLPLITQPDGFVGADGWIKFDPTGQVRRGLAVYRIERAGPVLMDPAPAPASGPGL